jgi:hypothetical protein
MIDAAPYPNVACGTPDPILKDVGNYAINRL